VTYLLPQQIKRHDHLSGVRMRRSERASLLRHT